MNFLTTVSNWRQFIQALLLGLESLLLALHIGHGIGQVFGAGDALTQFGPWRRLLDDGLDPLRNDSQHHHYPVIY